MICRKKFTTYFVCPIFIGNLNESRDTSDYCSLSSLDFLYFPVKSDNSSIPKLHNHAQVGKILDIWNITFKILEYFEIFKYFYKNLEAMLINNYLLIAILNQENAKRASQLSQLGNISICSKELHILEIAQTVKQRLILEPRLIKM